MSQLDAATRALVAEAARSIAEDNAFVRDVALKVGRLLRQEYRRGGNRWWLYSLGRRIRPLTDQEVRWHLERRHAPFVLGGLTPDDPRWFDPPTQQGR